MQDVTEAVPQNDVFHFALREAGRWLAAESLDVPFRTVFLTVKPHNGVASASFIEFSRTPPIEKWAHYQLGGLVAENLYKLTDIRNAHLEQYQTSCWSKVTPEALQAVLDVVAEGTHPDIIAIRQHPGFRDGIFPDAVKLCFCQLSDSYANLIELAEELVARESLFWEEPAMFLDSPLRLYRRIRKTRTPMLVDGKPLRPDLEIPESLVEIVGPERRWSKEAFRNHGRFRKDSFASHSEMRAWEE